MEPKAHFREEMCIGVGFFLSKSVGRPPIRSLKLLVIAGIRAAQSGFVGNGVTGCDMSGHVGWLNRKTRRLEFQYSQPYLPSI